MNQTLSPLDNRYLDKTFELHDYFGEKSILATKTKIELDYFCYLMNDALLLNVKLDDKKLHYIEALKLSLNTFPYTAIDDILKYEISTKHDIKAIEYFIRDKFKQNNIPHDQYIHFGLTSQDINSLCTSLTLHSFNDSYFVPMIKSLKEKITLFANRCDIAFPARTHGQLAVPTNLKKEINVFAYRLNRELSRLKRHKFYAKFGGAVGNLSAHELAFPGQRYGNSWEDYINDFVKCYGISRSKLTTQVDNNASISEYLDIVRLINNILIDFSRDIWMYNSYGYFKQQTTESEIGSSTMPQKINPINFENAEGNLELSNCLLEFMSNKLQISRMQRDLSDTTVVRNMGVPFGHAVVAYKSILEGIAKLSPNLPKINEDLKDKGLLAEAYQIILKKENVENGYEIINKMFKTGKIDFDKLNITDDLKQKLKSMSIEKYLSNVIKE